MRRSFHTLKGSGRIVGATKLGEFAWSVENLLNRVIDHSLEAGPDVFNTLDAALDVMPALIELNLILPGADLDRLMHGHVRTFSD